MQSNEIRSQFIKFFMEKGHEFIASSPVVPVDDPTLLFANAGMNQFKPIFLGQKPATVSRAVNSQKCIRAGGKHNDLDEVGKDGYHHTFFEMLGNWSFGDYYKKEAISWAWELLTSVYKLPKDKLHATVYTTDSEALDLWKSLTDINHEHISIHAEKDNFWEMGDSGPCGPCSEIHFDRGPHTCEKAGLDGHVCMVNGDCSRYIELWNLVFIQFNRDRDGILHPLDSVFVDTGAGLERICQVLQGKTTNYDTDLFQPLIQEIARMSNVGYSEGSGISHRVIADHIRCLCFALADGGFPSNEGRGYVLRRILRRAARHGRLLGFTEPFLWKLVDTLISQMGGHFTELNGKADFIKMIVKAEEERFNRTLDTGLDKFGEIAANSSLVIAGSDAFMLYDTYGFPLDLTQILAEERHLKVDLDGFNNEMSKQRERARAASKFTINIEDEDWIEFSASDNTEFVGYDQLSVTAFITKYSLKNDGKLTLVLDKTPFYAESGGQLADKGTIYSEEFEMEVEHVKNTDRAYLHIGKLIKGIISKPEVTLQVCESSRRDTARNHTATHLLHKALRDVLGDSVQQKGSLVSSEYLRFDFAYIKAVDTADLDAIENRVNEIIRENRQVITEIMDIDTARQKGATALFGEKYGAEVRVVSVDDYSQELCGGTHVSYTGEIGLLSITSESSSAAGIRRIEALTGRAAFERLKKNDSELREISQLLATSPQNLISKITGLQETLHKYVLEIKALKDKLILSSLDNILNDYRDIGEAKLIVKILPIDSELRAYGDLIADRIAGTIVLLFTVSPDNVALICIVSKDLTSKYHAGKIVQSVCKELGGKGGGRPDSAMGGAKNNASLDVVISSIDQIISSVR